MADGVAEGLGPAPGGFLPFIRALNGAMAAMAVRLSRQRTLQTRVTRRFSMTETADLLGLDAAYLARLSAEERAFPKGHRQGRERTFSPAEVMTIRAVLASNPHARKPYLHWRRPGDPLPVVTFGAQKGGTGKSLSAAHFAQYVSLNYGLRVGVIDADPQATLSLYFADDRLALFDPATPTLAEFMGVDSPGEARPACPDPAELDAVWAPTPWPGIRLIPGGPAIQNGDIALFMMARGAQPVPVYRVLKDALEAWDAAHPPRTGPHDLRGPRGFDPGRLEAALAETVDLVVIDQQPSLTLMQLNGLIAAHSVVIPQTMKGFDLATLATYVASIGDYLDFVAGYEPGLAVGPGRHLVLPTIVQEQNDRDTAQILDLWQRAPDAVAQVWYARSDAIANAAEEYKSIYEYLAPKARRASARAFFDNANAVNDALVGRTLPHLPQKGHAAAFVAQRWGG